MGDPRRQRSKYKTPRHPWKMETLQDELRLLGEYGLRNKRELWRYKAMLSKIRGMARSVLGMRAEDRREIEGKILGKLSRLGLISEGATLDDVLDLSVKDILERRLQTISFKLGLAKSLYQARQLVSHGHIAVGDRIVSVPGYLVGKEEQSRIGYSPNSPLSKSG
jgi:small subunit ribosomal protein S4